MAFPTPITIASVLASIRQNDYVLPAIQREFVWHRRGQIPALFDSLMRGYPIGTFLFWSVNADRCGDFKFYGFLSDYHERDRRRNSPIDVTGSRGVTAILDGQQRFTALNIGLRGSYAPKIKYGRWSADRAFPKRRLYLNLLRPAEVKTGVELKYDFSFLTKERAANPKDGEHWFLLKEVLDWRDLNNVMDYLREHSLWDTRYAQECLSKLLTVIHTEQLVSYYQEDEQDVDKVLNIFIRVNSGGTVLSYSDLLLSIATAQWETVDAREEIHGCVDGLNRTRSGFDFNKDLVLKACLVLSDVSDIGFKVRNFTHENMRRIEAQWDQISGALRVAAMLLSRFGYDGSTLTARNALIPVAYYVFCRGVTEARIRRPDFAADAREIQKWVRRALLKRGTFGAGLDTTLRAARTTIREKCADRFSYAEMESVFARIGRPLRFEEEELDDLLGRKFGSGAAFSVLALLYPHVDFANRFHVDHIFPRARFTAGRLRKARVDPENIVTYQDCKDRIANLQLLPGPENLAKGIAMPAEWIREQGYDHDWRARAYIGKIPEDMTGFLTFYEERRDRMKKRLAEILGVSPGEGTKVAE